MKDAYKKTIEEIYKELNVNENGLDKKEVKRLQSKNGKNVLIEKNKKTKLQIFLDQFKNIMIILLLVVGILSLIYSIITNSDFLEPIVILGTTLVNCIMGFLQESKAEDAIGKLKKYSTNYITVRRGGKYQEIDSRNLVVGDYLILEAGDKIPADARVVKSYFAKVDESILTGESLNIDKNEKTITKDVIISDRTNMIYSGTILVSGKIEAVVVATGMNTELGKIASVMDTKEEPITPLQMKVQKISRFITVVACILISFVLVFGIINNYDFLSLVMLCISMIVASVPECLPIAITATLSIGISQMAKKKSIVRNLAAIETLGATEVICTDKTGTITENKMKVTKIFDINNEINSKEIKEHQKFIEIIHYCNTATLNEDGTYNGDAVDVALKNYLEDNHIKCPKYKEVIELPFDSDRKMMSTINKIEDKNYLLVKGSFSSVIKNCTKYETNGKVKKLTSLTKSSFQKAEKKMSQDALKVLALAYRPYTEDPKKLNSKDEKNLIFVGLIGLIDPPRSDIKESIQKCKDSNITTLMITGDSLDTALAIAKEVGIAGSDKEGVLGEDIRDLSKKDLKKALKKYKVFARVTPDDKVKIVTALQEEGKIIAMTGDGVNDSPAIKLANVGVGMGKTGSDVTKNAADIILMDDSFSTIVTAVSEGRRIYDNVINNILYNLSSNFTEIIIILVGMFTFQNIISPIHILYIDLVADTLPSICLAFEKGSKNIMKRKPIGLNRNIFTPYFIAFLALSVIIEVGISLFVYYLFAQNFSQDTAQTMALLSIILNEFTFAYNCRSLKELIPTRGIFSNKQLNIGISVLILVQLLVFLTPVGQIFGLVKITLIDFILIFIINVIGFILIELIKPIITKFIKD